MSGPYRITLIHLTADASAVAPASERLDHGGSQPLEEVIRLADKLLKVDASAHSGAEPGIIVQRGE